MWNFFKKKKKDEFDPLKDAIIKNLKVGWVVDFDMKTWQVAAHHKYDWGGGSITDEWELQSGTEMIFLQYEPEDGGSFSISKRIPIGKIEGDIKAYLKEHDDGPSQIKYEGTPYYLDEDGGALFLENGDGPEQEFIFWEYIDDSEDKFISIEQWGDNEYEAHEGKVVQEYHFENILPVS